MAHAIVRQEIPAPAGTVWSMLGDLRAGPERWPAVAWIELEGAGVGCLRTLHLVDGHVIRERLESHDPIGRRYRCEVLSAPELPLRELHYTVTVEERSTRACTVEWALDFEPADAPEERVRGMLEGIYGSLRATILESLEGR